LAACESSGYEKLKTARLTRAAQQIGKETQAEANQKEETQIEMPENSRFGSSTQIRLLNRRPETI
jgi:hypothetical protein